GPQLPRRLDTVGPGTLCPDGRDPVDQAGRRDLAPVAAGVAQLSPCLSGDPTSCRFASRTADAAISTITMLNGRPPTTAAVWSAPRPPAVTRTAAIPTSKAIQTARVRADGLIEPPEDSVAITSAPESAEVT